jgi:dihydrodipicolinate synthase/N-acetylneuraminate lyase
MDLRGVFAPIPTPFDRDERVDLGRLSAACARWAASPLGGLVVLGSTGEAVLLDEDESDRIMAFTRERWPAGQARPFIVGAGRESTPATIRAVRRAADLGADAVLVRTPGFYKSQMTNDVFVRHYTAVADASPVPVLLYNFTAVTGVNLSPAAVSRLSTHSNIIGVKESSGDIAQMTDLVAGTPGDFSVLAGSSTTFCSALGVGAAGGVLALACVLPDACVRLFELTRGGRHAEAAALQHRLVPVARLVGTMHGVPGLKAALRLVGCDVGVPRSPFAPVSEAAVAALREVLVSFEEVVLA